MATADDLEVERTRTSNAWAAAAVGAVLVLLMLIFVLQNSDDVRMDFLWMHVTVPLGAALLLAAVIGALIVVSLGVGRMLQLRLAARRHRRADHQARGGPAVSGPATEPVSDPTGERTPA